MNMSAAIDLNNPAVMQLASMLAQTDARDDTAAPDIDQEDAAGLPDEQDAAGPEEEALAENTGDVGALLRLKGKASYTAEEVAYMMARATQRGKRATVK